MRRLVRVGAFVSKEIGEVLRQPRLVMVLIAGPFAVLLLFGAGFREDLRWRAVFVAPPDSELSKDLKAYAGVLDRYVILKGVVSDEDQAKHMLRDGKVDLVAVAPPDAAGDVLAGRQANFIVWHNQLDPVEISAVRFAALLAASEVNKKILENVVAKGQESTDSLDQALQALASETSSRDVSTASEAVNKLRTLDPGLLVAPLQGEAKQVLPPPDSRPTPFYAPGAVALLLQHMGITFGALSIVRDRELGAVEVFRVSPLGPGESLLGKYLAYLLLGSALATVLVVLLWIPGLLVMTGSWGWFVFVLVGVLAASLGIGFLISLVAGSDSQAVQWAMIILLASLFFSGLFISLDRLQPAVRALSWALPVTYGVQGLRDVSLRGIPPDPIEMVRLWAIAVGLYALCTFVTSRRAALR